MRWCLAAKSSGMLFFPHLHAYCALIADVMGYTTMMTNHNESVIMRIKPL